MAVSLHNPQEWHLGTACDYHADVFCVVLFCYLYQLSICIYLYLCGSLSLYLSISIYPSIDLIDLIDLDSVLVICRDTSHPLPNISREIFLGLLGSPVPSEWHAMLGRPSGSNAWLPVPSIRAVRWKKCRVGASMCKSMSMHACTQRNVHTEIYMSQKTFTWCLYLYK